MHQFRCGLRRRNNTIVLATYAQYFIGIEINTRKYLSFAFLFFLGKSVINPFSEFQADTYTNFELYISN